MVAAVAAATARNGHQPASIHIFYMCVSMYGFVLVRNGSVQGLTNFEQTSPTAHHLMASSSKSESASERVSEFLIHAV